MYMALMIMINIVLMGACIRSEAYYSPILFLLLSLLFYSWLKIPLLIIIIIYVRIKCIVFCLLYTFACIFKCTLGMDSHVKEGI